MIRRNINRNIFSKKASYVLRKLIQKPDDEWVIRDFTDDAFISIGMVHAVLKMMDRSGYIEWIKKGAKSYIKLVEKERLLNDWAQWYSYDLNDIDSYYNPDPKLLEIVSSYLKPEIYALTLHSGANIITSYINTNEIYLYLKTENWDKEILRIRQDLDLKELVNGGNIHFLKPYYRDTVFYNSRVIRKYSIVSNLQLYLDLFNFQPRGKEHALFLKELLAQKGKNVD